MIINSIIQAPEKEQKILTLTVTPKSSTTLSFSIANAPNFKQYCFIYNGPSNIGSTLYTIVYGSRCGLYNGGYNTTTMAVKGSTSGTVSKLSIVPEGSPRTITGSHIAETISDGLVTLTIKNTTTYVFNSASSYKIVILYE